MQIHGVLNTLAWGIILPLGVLIARYIKSLNPSSPAWFHGHKICQSIGYVLGVAGFALGLKLGSESKGITHYSHRNMGIAVFSLATIQVCLLLLLLVIFIETTISTILTSFSHYKQVSALLLRPKPTHKKRIYWNLYHYTVGIVVIALGITNIFEGFEILSPDKKWKRLYVFIICAIFLVAPIFEVCKWTVCRNRKSESYTKPENQTSEWAVTV